MRDTLHIDGRRLGDGMHGLRRLILEHTECERSTARILLDLTNAVRSGPVEFCVISPNLPLAARDSEPLPWIVHIAAAAGPPAAELEAA
jgi:hypothetical protein